MSDDNRNRNRPRPRSSSQGRSELPQTPEDKTSPSDIDFGKFVSDASRRWSSSRPASEADGRKSTSAARKESGGGGDDLPPTEPGTSSPTPPNRNILLLGILGVIAIVLSFVAVDQLRDSPTEPETPVPTLQPTELPLPTSTIAQPTATVPPEATKAPTPTTEPTIDITTSELAMSCPDTCLIRTLATDQTTAILRTTGDRESFRFERWTWTVATRVTIAMLDQDGHSVTVLGDSPDTLNLYVATLPDGQTDFSVLGGFGNIIDSIDRTAIVRVDQIPAQVKALAEAGVDIQKLAPGMTRKESPGSGTSRPVLAEADIGGLANDVSADEIQTTLTELQASSSTDATGIGSRQYLKPGNVMSAEYLFRRLEGYGFSVRYEDFISPEGTLASNVIAELPGRDASAIYGVMAHFDSTAEDFSVAPGADDNATGVAASLEIARILGQYELEHPVVIVFVNSEETGIIGSRVFAANALASKVPYEGIFNLDSVGSDRRGALMYLNSDARSEWMMSLMIRVNQAYGLGQDIQSRQNSGIVADDNRLREQGFESILIARELFGSSPYHHTSNDIIANLSLPNTVSATQLMLLTIASLCVP